MTRELHESKMSPTVSQWLQSLGCDVYAEVPHHCSSIDLVGVCWPTNRIVAVEMKMSLSRKVIHQAGCAQSMSRHSYAAVSTRPRAASVLLAAKYGVGVLRVDGERVHVVIEPKTESHPAFGAQRMLDLLRRFPLGGVGGNPQLKGVGPAQDVDRAIIAYRMENPKATWKEVFKAVPNHYVSAKSMAGAMAMLERRRAWQRRREEART